MDWLKQNLQKIANAFDNLEIKKQALTEEINKLEPFGMSNPSPTFAIKNMTLKQKIVGQFWPTI